MYILFGKEKSSVIPKGNAGVWLFMQAFTAMIQKHSLTPKFL